MQFGRSRSTGGTPGQIFRLLARPLVGLIALRARTVLDGPGSARNGSLMLPHCSSRKLVRPNRRVTLNSFSRAIQGALTSGCADRCVRRFQGSRLDFDANCRSVDPRRVPPRTNG